MPIDKRHLKNFFSFDFIDAIFFAAIGFTFTPWATKDNQIFIAVAVLIIAAYLLAFLIKNCCFYYKRIWKNKHFDFLALFFTLNFSFLFLIFIYKNAFTNSFDIQRIFKLSEPSVVLFYLWGIISIAAVMFKDKYKKKELLQAKASGDD